MNYAEEQREYARQRILSVTDFESKTRLEDLIGLAWVGHGQFDEDLAARLILADGYARG